MAAKLAKIDPLGALADELGAIEKYLAPKMAPLKPAIARAEKLRKLLRDAHEVKPAWTAYFIKGEKFTVELGPRGSQDRVNVVKLAKLITPQALWGLVSCTLKNLWESDVNPAVIAQVIDTSATGTRPITITEAP
jgi:hypothetical protein